MRKVAYILVFCACWTLGAGTQNAPAPTADPGTLDPGTEVVTPTTPPGTGSDRGGAPPECDAGGDPSSGYEGECEGYETTFQLDGTGSYDPDGSALVLFDWNTDCPGGAFDDHYSPTPILVVDTENMYCSIDCQVQLYVEDVDGMSTTCYANVTIYDSTPPTIDIEAQNETVECDGYGNDTEFHNWLDDHGGAEASDLCSNIDDYDWETIYDSFSDDCGETGSINVEFKVRDECWNSASTYATFTIEDTLDPWFDTHPYDETFECDYYNTEYDIDNWLHQPMGRDECSYNDVEVTHDYFGLSGGCGGLTGEAYVTFTATDDCGNSLDESATVTVQDNYPPYFINHPGSAYFECDRPDLDSQVQAWLDGVDAVDEHECSIVTVENDFTGIENYCGDYGTEVTWTATDECGHETQEYATLYVEDHEPPEWTYTPSDTTMECSPSIEDQVQAWVASATASDNCNDVTVDDDFTGLSDECGPTGSATVEWTAEDECGYSAEPVVATITVEDTTVPEIDLTVNGGQVNDECYFDVTFSATVTDNCCIDVADVTVQVGLIAGVAQLGTPTIDKTQTSETEVTITGSVRVSNLEVCPAVVSVSVTAVDCCGESTLRSESANVVDNTVPTIEGSATGGVVDDDCKYEVPFSATITENCCINLEDVTVDVTLPTTNATLGEPIVYISYTDVGIAVSGTVEVSGLTGCPATVQITVDAVDCCDNAATQFVMTADVVDETIPIITCDSVGGEVDENCEYLMPFSATIEDNCCVTPDDVTVNVSLLTGNATLGVPTIQIEQDPSDDGRVLVEGAVLVSDLTGCPATVQVTVDAVDCCDNPADQCVTTADVNDTIDPVITCPDDITLERGDKLCSSDVQDWLDSATATDNCDTDVDIVEDSAENGYECGFPYDSTTEVTWTATDDCGNTDECSALITIKKSPRVDMSRKGSLLIFSKVELRWSASGELIQDTFLDISNDYPGWVAVQMYFFNGDPPTEVTPNDRAHLGWNWVDNFITLTGDQPAYWSAATGAPKGVSPFTVLDPSDDPALQGRPVNDGTTDRVLRGMVLAWAVNPVGEEIRWNHLKGDALIVNYGKYAAWEYGAWAFSTRCLAQGEQPLDCLEFDANGVCCTADVIPGNLDLDAFQYDLSFDELILDFYAPGSGYPGAVETIDGDLTLFPAELDLRQETTGPVTTKAKFDIWNMNEVKFSNTERCITCWDQELLSLYDAPNSFLREHLQTNKGKARIDGMQSMLCEDSVAASLLGVSMKMLGFNAGVDLGLAGNNLFGSGYQSGRIQYDPSDEPPPELAPPAAPVKLSPTMSPSGSGATPMPASGE